MVNSDPNDPEPATAVPPPAGGGGGRGEGCCCCCRCCPPEQPPPVDPNDPAVLSGILSNDGSTLLNVAQTKMYQSMFPNIANACRVDNPERATVHVVTVIGDFDDLNMYICFTRHCAAIAHHIREKGNTTGRGHVMVIQIDSHGGQVESLARMLTALRTLEHSFNELKIATFCTGVAMSCGAVLFGQGQYRFADTTRYKAAAVMPGAPRREMIGTQILIHAPWGRSMVGTLVQLNNTAQGDQVATAIVYDGFNHGWKRAVRAWYADRRGPVTIKSPRGAEARKIISGGGGSAKERSGIDIEELDIEVYVRGRSVNSDQLILAADDLGPLCIRSHLDLITEPSSASGGR